MNSLKYTNTETVFGLGLSNKIRRGRAVGQYYVLTTPNGTIAHYFDSSADRAEFLSGGLNREVSKTEIVARERI